MSTTDPIPDVPPEPTPTQDVLQKTQGVSFAFTAIIALLLSVVCVKFVIMGGQMLIPNWSIWYSLLLGGMTLSAISGAFSSWGGTIWAIVYFSLVLSILAGYVVLYGYPPSPPTA